MHEEEGKEQDEEVRLEVKGEVEELRQKRSSWMAWRWNDGLKDDLSQCGVTRDQQKEYLPIQQFTNKMATKNYLTSSTTS